MVEDFIADFEDYTHHIFCDSFFSGLPTAEKLTEAKQKFTICCQANRPTFLWTKQLHTGLAEKGDIQYTCHPTKDILAVSWLDNNKVNILTNTVSEPTRIMTCKVKNLGNKRIMRIKSLPNVVMDYRKGMGCVDRANSRSNRYRFHHRVRKWPRAAFFGLLQMMITDAWLIYKTARNITFPRKAYLLELIDVLALPTRKRKRPCTKTPKDRCASLPHMPIIVKPEKRGTCQYCEMHVEPGKRAPRGNCTNVCLACSDKEKHLVYLHVNKPCFALWHGVDLSSLPYAKELN